MNRKLRSTASRIGAVGAVALVLVAGPLLTGAPGAQPPQSPPPPLPVLEQNLDANGNIRVHEQGIAQVNGTVTVQGGQVSVQGGSISVDNLPSALNVHQSPVAGALAWRFTVGNLTYMHVPFSAVNATAIHISMQENSDKLTMYFQSPSSALEDPAIPNLLLRFNLHNIPGGNFVQTFPQPVPLNGMVIGCNNDFLESSCNDLLISIIGSSQ